MEEGGPKKLLEVRAHFVIPSSCNQRSPGGLDQAGGSDEGGGSCQHLVSTAHPHTLLAREPAQLTLAHLQLDHYL